MAREKSELQSLLEKNVVGGGLTPIERDKANYLIKTPDYNGNNCWVCKRDKSIYDTGLCKYHATSALAVKK